MYSVVDIDKYFSSKSTYLSHVYNIQLSTYVYTSISFLYLPRYIYIFQSFCNVENSDVKWIEKFLFLPIITMPAEKCEFLKKEKHGHY